MDSATIRALEHSAAATLPPHTLMQRAGDAVARLARAVAPHARTVWIACGPGNNGGDGLEAAHRLRQAGARPVVTWLGDASRMPADALASLRRAQNGGVEFAPTAPAGMGPQDLCIDALLGLGARHDGSMPASPQQEALALAVTTLNNSPAPVLAVDLPTGLDADSGAIAASAVQARWTLSLLALKPGLFTAHGRDAAGEIWFDPIGVDAGPTGPVAMLSGPHARPPRPHASHKGSHGDVAVIGGAPGMGGAAWLAAQAALHGGAGRVYLGLLDPDAPTLDARASELMWRRWDSLALEQMSVACGCGGGDAVRETLVPVLARARRLVLDADALNAIAADSALQTQLRARAARGQPTVLTPHPLEAARLLGQTTAQVQAQRLQAARVLAETLAVTVVLKGSGTLIATPGRTLQLNPTGNARLATAGTGDVLAGLLAAWLARHADAHVAATAAVYQHGAAADHWPAGLPLVAGALACALSPDT